MEFFNVNDANMYLSSSIVRIGDEPIYVYEVGAGMKVVYHMLADAHTDKPVATVDVRSLNMMPVPLGYANTDAGSLYLTRIPERRVKQGLGLERIRTSDGRQARIKHALPAVADCILNIYPDIKAAYAAAKEDGMRIAFHRHFAISYAGNIFYKDDKIGSYKGDKLSLTRNYIYLRELIQETFDGLL